MAIDPRIRARRVAVKRAEGRRRLRFLLGALGLVGLAVGAWALTLTPLLDLDHIRVVGVEGADAREVEEVAGLERGTGMFDLDLERVERELHALPWIRSATAARDWPGTVQITVEAREPVAVIGPVEGGPSFLADADGVLIRAADDEPTVPRVAIAPTVGLGEVEARALPGLAIAVALPDDLLTWVDAVTVGEGAGPGRVELGLDLVGSASVHLGSLDFVDDKLSALRAVLEGTDLACIEVIDVAVADLPTVTRGEGCGPGDADATVSGDG